MKPELLQMKSLVCNIFNEHYKWPVYIISVARADHGRKWPHDYGRLQRKRKWQYIVAHNSLVAPIVQFCQHKRFSSSSR
jgi:hypothetical protein